MGAWSRFDKDRNIAKIRRESRIQMCIHTDGAKVSKCCDSSPNPMGGPQEAEGGERQASRIWHALPEAVIHLLTYYASSW